MTFSVYSERLTVLVTGCCDCYAPGSFLDNHAPDSMFLPAGLQGEGCQGGHHSPTRYLHTHDLVRIPALASCFPWKRVRIPLRIDPLHLPKQAHEAVRRCIVH